MAEKPQLEAGEKVYLGLDLSSKTDLTSLIAVSAKMVIGCARGFEARRTLREHITRDRVPYDVWKKDGWLDTSPGRSIDYDFVADKVAELSRTMGVGMAYDRWGLLISCNPAGGST